MCVFFALQKKQKALKKQVMWVGGWSWGDSGHLITTLIYSTFWLSFIIGQKMSICVVRCSKSQNAGVAYAKGKVQKHGHLSARESVCLSTSCSLRVEHQDRMLRFLRIRLIADKLYIISSPTINKTPPEYCPPGVLHPEIIFLHPHRERRYKSRTPLLSQSYWPVYEGPGRAPCTF